METATDVDRPVKRARVDGPQKPVSQELAVLQKPANQLNYLQAQLAASKALHAAYQDELKLLAKHLSEVKGAHVRAGKTLWKAGTSPPCKPSGRKASDDSAPETFSDIEEAAIVNTEDDASAAEGFWPAPGAAAVPPGEKHSVQGSADLAAGDTAQGSTAEGGAAGPGGGVGPAGAPSVLVLAPPADFDRLVDLEAACSAVAQEDMEAQAALACLAGRAAKYYLRTAAVTLGRTTDSKGDVDIDLTGEEQQQQQQMAAPTGGVGGEPGEQGGGTGAAGSQVSRRQALIRLGADGVFRLTNMGRQVVLVNGVEVPQHHTAALPHLALVEVATVRLLFMANLAAAARVMRRSAALSP